MVSAFREIDVLNDLYTEDSPSEVNLKRLAQLLQVEQKALAEAFDISEAALSKKPYAPHNMALKQWLAIFNLIIRIISESEPTLTPEAIKVKMQRWLKLPRPEFDNQSAIDFMLKGKARRVINILEQLST
jgi:hypothetical protein